MSEKDDLGCFGKAVGCTLLILAIYSVVIMVRESAISPWDIYDSVYAKKYQPKSMRQIAQEWETRKTEAERKAKGKLNEMNERLNSTLADLEKRLKRKNDKLKQDKEMFEQKLEQKRLELKERKIQCFAMRESSSIAKVYQYLPDEIKAQNDSIEKVRKKLIMLGRTPEKEKGFRELCAKRDEMVTSFETIKKKLEDGYIADCKYRLMLGERKYGELQKKFVRMGFAKRRPLLTNSKICATENDGIYTPKVRHEWNQNDVFFPRRK